MGVFGHFVHMLLRPRLALELATGCHVDRSQPATLMSFAVPFAVPPRLEEGLAALHKGLADRRFSLWLQVCGAAAKAAGAGRAARALPSAMGSFSLGQPASSVALTVASPLQCRNLRDQWALQHGGMAAAASSAPHAGLSAAPHLPGGGPSQPLVNACLGRAARRGSVWVVVPGCRLRQLAHALNKTGSKQGWPRNHSAFFSTRFGRDLDALLATCTAAAVPFHVRTRATRATLRGLLHSKAIWSYSKRCR
jgi:hypothetical protein